MFWVLEIIMGPNAEIYTLNQVKELLQMLQNTHVFFVCVKIHMLNVFYKTIERLDNKIDI